MRVVSNVTAAPHETGGLIDLLTRVAGATRQEPGCVAYDLFEDVDDPTNFTMIAEFADRAAYEEHIGQPYMQDLLVELPSLTTGEIESRMLKAIEE